MSISPKSLSRPARHAGQAPDPATGARAAPICQANSFVFISPSDAANMFARKALGSLHASSLSLTLAVLKQ